MGSYFVNNEHYDLEFHRAMEAVAKRLVSCNAAELDAKGLKELFKLSPPAQSLLLTDLNG